MTTKGWTGLSRYILHLNSGHAAAQTADPQVISGVNLKKKSGWGSDPTKGRLAA